MSRSARRAARVVLLGPSDAVLLVSGRDPADDGPGLFWYTPGGGLEQDEQPEEAACREAREEVGARLGHLGPVVWRRRSRFVFDGRDFFQEEVFYVVRTPHFEPVPHALTDLEVRSRMSARWWDLDELARSGETVYPAQLVALVRDWLDNGPPPAPLEIG